MNVVPGPPDNRPPTQPPPPPPPPPTRGLTVHLGAIALPVQLRPFGALALVMDEHGRPGLGDVYVRRHRSPRVLATIAALAGGQPGSQRGRPHHRE